MQENKFKALVLDSGAFISHASIVNAAEEYYSIEEVLSEVRDKYARESLDRFPFEIKYRRPSKEAIDIVEKFAKATGDFPRLAQTDLLLIALTYDLQKEVGGVDNVNINCLLDRSRIVDVHEKRIIGVNVSAEPCKYVDTPEGCKFGVDCLYRHPGDIERSSLEKKEEPQPVSPSTETPQPARPLRKWNVIQPAPSTFGSDDRFPALGSHVTKEDQERNSALYNNPKIQEIFAIKKGEEEIEESEENSAENSAENSVEENSVEENSAEENSVEENSVEENSVEENSAEENSAEDLTELPLQDSASAPPAPTKSHILGGSSLVNGEVAEEDDGGEWIDSFSLSSFHNNTTSVTPAEEEEIDRSQFAACCTGDYAMQNVLLQMNLQLLSYENKRITTLRVSTRRCRDCFYVCNDDSKLFCPDCGHPSLAKVPVMVLKGGIVRVGMPYESKSLRGTIYSVSKNADLLYCEDQLHSGKWLRRVQNMKRAKKEGCIFGEVGAESLGLAASTSRKNDYMDSIVVGFGRRNPNAMKGREKRGKKKAKKASRY